MWLETAFRILGGALAGGVLGYLLSHARRCSSDACDSRPPSLAARLFYIIATAVFGAGIAWYYIHR